MLDYDIGDRPTITVTFTDTTGAPTSPSSVTFLTRKPDGTEITSTPTTGPTAGIVTLFMPTLDQAGTWHIRCKGTGVLTAAVEVSFPVRRSAFASP